MKNSIPEKFIFSCELFRSVERTAIKEHGKSGPDVLKAIISKRISTEHNQILLDLYRQMLECMSQPGAVIHKKINKSEGI